MIGILHELIYQNPANYGSTVYIFIDILGHAGFT